MSNKPIYEIHITCLVSQKAAAKQIAEQLHWKTSEIERDPVLGNDTYFYLTKYATNVLEAFEEIREVTSCLFEDNVKIVREKIELIIHDVKYVI